MDGKREGGSEARLQMRSAPFFPLPPSTAERRKLAAVSSRVESHRKPAVRYSSPDVFTGCDDFPIRPRSSTKRRTSTPIFKASPSSKSKFNYSHIKSKTDSRIVTEKCNVVKRKSIESFHSQSSDAQGSGSWNGDSSRLHENSRKKDSAALSVNSRLIKRIRSQAKCFVDCTDPFPQVHTLTHDLSELVERESFSLNSRFYDRPKLVRKLLYRRLSFCDTQSAVALERKKVGLLVSTHRKWKSLEDLRIDTLDDVKSNLPKRSQTLPNRGKGPESTHFLQEFQRLLASDQSSKEETASADVHGSGSGSKVDLTAGKDCVGGGGNFVDLHKATITEIRHDLQTTPPDKRWDLQTTPPDKWQESLTTPNNKRRDLQTTPPKKGSFPKEYKDKSQGVSPLEVKAEENRRSAVMSSSSIKLSSPTNKQFHHRGSVSSSTSKSPKQLPLSLRRYVNK